MEGAGRLAVNVGTVALLGFGGMLVIRGRISVGALLAGEGGGSVREERGACGWVGGWVGVGDTPAAHPT